MTSTVDKVTSSWFRELQGPQPGDGYGCDYFKGETDEGFLEQQNNRVTFNLRVRGFFM
jgi:hypothetical protein